MRSGDRRRPRGFTWWGMLLVLALSGTALAALGRQWSVQLQREREAELRFRGEQIREAIGRYRAARQPAAWPSALDDLLDDPRVGLEDRPRHHLRRRWTDPFTGQADWELLPAPPPQTGFVGVRSRSGAARLATDGTPAATPGGARVSDWRFVQAAGDEASPGRATTSTRGGVRP